MVYLIAFLVLSNSSANSLTVHPHSRFAMMRCRWSDVKLGRRRLFPEVSARGSRRGGIVEWC
jgi:hypothetical protein